MNHFIWDINPEIVNLGFLAPRWYGLCFALAMLSGYYIIRRGFLASGRSEELYNEGFILVVLGTIIGARLGHCLFYEPEYYLTRPWKILFVWEGGLASHGGTVGILLVIAYFCWKHRIPWVWLADRMAVGIPVTAAFIRIGNFLNSEIIGKPTDKPWAIIFKRVDDLPRHPSQLYEAASYFLLFGLLFWLDRKFGDKLPTGKLIGIMFVWIFGSRIAIEFTKENQVAFEQGMDLNMGQLLSIPMILLGLFFFFGLHNRINFSFANRPASAGGPAEATYHSAAELEAARKARRKARKKDKN